MVDLLNKLVESGMLYFFLVSLISAESLHTPADCDVAITRIQEIIKALPDTSLDDETKDKIMKFCQDGLVICERDKKELEKIS